MLLVQATVIEVPTLTRQIGIPLVPAVSPASPPAELEIDIAAWDAFAGSQANTLVVGEPAAVTRVLTVAWLNLRRPVVWSDQVPLRLPPEPVGTFILWRADDLSSTDQQRLLGWLDANQSARVITRSSRDLFSLVREGAFAEGLYYRLNTVRMMAPAFPSRG